MKIRPIRSRGPAPITDAPASPAGAGQSLSDWAAERLFGPFGPLPDSPRYLGVQKIP
jgi:hypothetical protein